MTSEPALTDDGLMSASLDVALGNDDPTDVPTDADVPLCMDDSSLVPPVRRVNVRSLGVWTENAVVPEMFAPTRNRVKN